ncbi:hypothetical protein DL768_001315 [Monosporascus sp. mg162]|nr:hypothetical protein DL768_001315 [Monosporascus sp. mg162]
MATMSRVPLRCNPYTWEILHDSKFAGTKFAAVLRAQLLDGGARLSSTRQSCAVLGSVNRGHLLTRLKASKMKVASPGDSEPSRLPIQIYSCPGRHVYEGPRLLGGRYSSQRAKEWRGPREYLRGMCPRHVSAVLGRRAARSARGQRARAGRGRGHGDAVEKGVAPPSRPPRVEATTRTRRGDGELCPGSEEELGEGQALEAFQGGGR